MRISTALPALYLFLLPLAGCKSFDEKVAPARKAYFEGEYARAEKLLQPYVEKAGKNKPVFVLEQSLPQLAQHKLGEAKKSLRETRDQFDRYEQKLATEWVGSLLVDDTTIAYPGEDYEKILIRVMLALGDLLGEGGDAIAYSNQIIHKQNQIIDRSPEIEGKKIKANYKHLGIGRYLVAILREEEYNYGVAERNFRKVLELEPGFPYAREDLERVEKGIHSAKGNGVLYVFALVDRGPYKVQTTHTPSTVAVHMTWILASLIGQKLVTPSIIPVKIPKLVRPGRTISDVGVEVDGVSKRPTGEILNVYEAAKQQFDTIRDWIVARALLRRLVKKAIVETGKRVIQNQQKEGSDAQVATEIGAFAANLIWEATEKADTRCWGCLPASLQVVRVELPAGRHNITLVPRRGGGAAGRPVEARVLIEDGRNSYCVAIFPRLGARPSVLVSHGPLGAESRIP